MTRISDAPTTAPQAATAVNSFSDTEAGELLQAAALESKGDFAGAVELYRHALSVNPCSFAAWNNLGNLFASLKDWPTARVFLEQAERLNPPHAGVKNNLANVLGKCGEFEVSVGRYRAAMALEPENPQFRNNLGNALREVGDWTGAEEMLTSAIAIQGNYPAAFANLAYLVYEQGRLAEAEGLYRRALDFDPGYALAHTCLGQLLLYRGCFEEGWKEQEWRWKWDDFPSPQRHFEMPQWCGEDISGKRILLHAEQGFGDTIQFARYVPMVAALGARVTFEVHPELVSLMGSIAGVSELVARGDSLPPFDLHCPLMSLPFAFRTTLETIPGAFPYLHGRGPIPEWVRNAGACSLRVGLVWAGDAANKVDGKRSLSVEELGPIIWVAGVAFYSFQRGRVRPDKPPGLPFQGSLPQSADFAATAAAVCEMDLLISVDTAVAHLAGALGVPVWILLPYVCDWRWLDSKPDSPWYPTARLFRQKDDRKWSPVVAEVSSALLDWTKVTTPCRSSPRPFRSENEPGWSVHGPA